MSKGRNPKKIDIFGRSMTTREWSKLTQIPTGAISLRLRLGWEPERAFSHQ
jgi:hypothetical protein